MPKLSEISRNKIVTQSNILKNLNIMNNNQITLEEQLEYVNNELNKFTFLKKELEKKIKEKDNDDDDIIVELEIYNDGILKDLKYIENISNDKHIIFINIDEIDKNKINIMKITDTQRLIVTTMECSNGINIKYEIRYDISTVDPITKITKGIYSVSR